ncbi:MAG: FtsL-like putative cell division protein [Muribaculaceae bacterium]
MANEKNKKSTTASTGAEVRKWSLQLFLGDLISSKFFTRHKFSIIGMVVLLILYISFQYECKTRMETIDNLNKELAIVQSESIRQKSTYHSRIRESVMQQMVDSMRLGLKVQDQPPFKITYTNEN